MRHVARAVTLTLSAVLFAAGVLVLLALAAWVRLARPAG